MPAKIACLLRVSHTKRGQKTQVLSRGRPGRRSDGCLRRRIPALQRVHVFQANRRRERDQHLDEAAHRYACCCRATQQRLHVLGRVVERPGLVVDRLPLLPCSSWGAASAGMFHVVCVEVRLHRDALLPEDLMVLRAGQRGQAEELDDVERQLALNDRDIAPDRLRRVRRKAQDVPGKRDDALRLPGQQHLAILGDLVLALLRRGEIVRIDVLQTDEHARDAGPLRLLHEVRNLVAQRVDLDHQAERDSVLLAQLDQAVEDRLPLLVAREIVVGDEEFVDALRPVEAHETLDVVGER